MLTLQDALLAAFDHWSLDRPGTGTMRTAASRCVAIVGPATDSASVTPALAVRLLKGLRDLGLSPKTVGVYYQAFKSVLTMAGHPPVGWPKAPSPPRRTRDRISTDDLERLIAWFRYKCWDNTADLAVLLRATGLRVNVEALDCAHLIVLPPGHDDDPEITWLHITGKGGHERVIPVAAKDARDLLGDPKRLAAMRALGYSGHLKRWSEGVSQLGITSRLATPHSVRHGYASEALRNSGGNVKLVSDLLGHADLATTSKYLSVDRSGMAKAVPTG